MALKSKILFNDSHAAQIAAVFFGFTVFSNATVIGIARVGGVGRAFILNIDFILALLISSALSLALGRRLALLVGGALVSLVFAVDLWVHLGGIYLSDYMMLVDMLPFIEQWPWRILGPILLLLYFVSLAMLWPLGKVIQPRVAIVSATVFLLLSLAMDSIARRLDGPNILSSGTASLFRPMVNQFANRDPGLYLGPARFPEDTFATTFDPDSSGKARRILIIGVESWGVSRSNPVNQDMLSVITRTLGDRWQVRKVEHRQSIGSTLHGEVRELCGLLLQGLPRTDEQRGALRECLPARLRSRGYETSAWHGNSGKFYHRREVYRAMGFGSFSEFSTLVGSVSETCIGAFVGICDRDVVNASLAWLSRRELAFAHVMTLDTHFPLRRHTDDMGCGLDELCVYLRHMERTLTAIGEEIRDSDALPDMVIIYGDHPPPFFNAEVRDTFEPKQIPVIRLELADSSAVES